MAWFFWPDMRPELKSARVATNSPTIVVGRNIQVSVDRPKVIHQGCTIDVDPTDANRLFVASMIGYEPNGILGYWSHDGGATWHLGYDGTGRRGCDESLAFGPDGTLHLVHMRESPRTGDDKRYNIPGPPPGFEDSSYDVEFYRSLDGGKNFEKRQTIEQFIDRPQLAVDCTNSKYRGTVYCNANEGTAWAVAYRAARDTGEFLPSELPQRKIMTPYPSNPVILSDGTVVCCYNEVPRMIEIGAPPILTVLRSNNGGQFFALAGRVATAYKHPTFRSWLAATPVPYPILAVDSSPKFRDRLFCVWVDGPQLYKTYILCSSSDDRGATWSAPVVLSEQPLDQSNQDIWTADYPAIAVNRDGVVAVTWYDRRGREAQIRERPGPNVRYPILRGYDLRIRLSTDGGESWSASKIISEKPGEGELVEVRGWV